MTRPKASSATAIRPTAANLRLPRALQAAGAGRTPRTRKRERAGAGRARPAAIRRRGARSPHAPPAPRPACGARVGARSAKARVGVAGCKRERAGAGRFREPAPVRVPRTTASASERGRLPQHPSRSQACPSLPASGAPQARETPAHKRRACRGMWLTAPCPRSRSKLLLERNPNADMARARSPSHNLNSRDLGFYPAARSAPLPTPLPTPKSVPYPRLDCIPLSRPPATRAPRRGQTQGRAGKEGWRAARGFAPFHRSLFHPFRAPPLALMPRPHPFRRALPARTQSKRRYGTRDLAPAFSKAARPGLLPAACSEPISNPPPNPETCAISAPRLHSALESTARCEAFSQRASRRSAPNRQDAFGITASGRSARRFQSDKRADVRRM